VRSYRKSTSVEILVSPAYRFYLHSFHGTLALERWYRVFLGRELMPHYRGSDLLRLTANAGVSIQRSPTGTKDAVCFSYWLLSVSTIILAALPWLRWRFTLRTLLIAMTLVAVVLGLIVWLNHY
jgi:hypothetical protein